MKLDANENPYGPPPQVLEALGSMDFPHIYPDPECRRLRSLLADYVGVPAENLLVGCGADELIDLLMRCVLDPGDVIIDTPPTFTIHEKLPVEKWTTAAGARGRQGGHGEGAGVGFTPV